MRRSFRTPEWDATSTQGCTLGWYAAPRWGAGGNDPILARSVQILPGVAPWACTLDIGGGVNRPKSGLDLLPRILPKIFGCAFGAAGEPGAGTPCRTRSDQ